MKIKLFSRLAKRYQAGFTLIELIVTSAIILLLIGVAAPSYDRVRAHNELNLSGQKLQNCINQAKSLALGPAKTDVDLVDYRARITNQAGSNNPIKCEVIKATKDLNNLDGDSDPTTNPILQPLTSTVTLENYLKSNFASGTSIDYIFDPNDNGKVQTSSNSFYLYDQKNRCLNLKIVSETGNLLLEKVGNVVTVGGQSNCGVISGSSTISDTRPPVIVHSPPGDSDFNKDLLIRARVTDYVGVKQVQIFIRQGGTTTWSGTSMQAKANNYYESIIPSIPTLGTYYANSGSFEYYLKATDHSGNVETSPTSSPPNNIPSPPHIITLFDSNIPPNITHTVPTSINSNVNYTFSAAITDDIAVQGVQFFYRPEGGIWSSPIAMTTIDNLNYTYTIASSVFTAYVNQANGVAKKLEYYIKATDNAGKATFEPQTAPSTYNSVTIIDNTKPTITNANAQNINGTSAEVIWQTDEPANSRVDYGLTTSYGSSVSNTNYDWPDHQLTLSGLVSGQTYYYKITTKDAKTNSATKAGSFTTLDTTPPVISNFQIYDIVNNGFTFSLTTNENASISAYALTKSSDGSLVTINSAVTEPGSTLTNIAIKIRANAAQPNTSYNFKVKVSDSTGNPSWSPVLPLTTAGVLSISNIKVNSLGNKQYKVSWTTDQLSDSNVDWRFSCTANGQNHTTDSTLTTAHAVTITIPNNWTGFCYRVKSFNTSPLLGAVGSWAYY